MMPLHVVPIRSDITERIDALLSPADQRAVAEAWASQPGESMEWAIDNVQRLLAADPELSHARPRLPLPVREPRGRAQRAVEMLTRRSRRNHAEVAAIALQAAALAFLTRDRINPRTFGLLTAGYAALGVPQRQVELMLKVSAALRGELPAAA